MIQLVEVSVRNKTFLMLKNGVVIANLLSNRPWYKHLGFELEIRARKSNSLQTNLMSKHPFKEETRGKTDVYSLNSSASCSTLTFEREFRVRSPDACTKDGWKANWQ